MMESLFRLREKVEALLRRYIALQDENEALHKTLRDKDDEIMRLREALSKEEMNVMATQIGQTIFDPEARAAGRRKLDEVIGEIDKILTTLP